MGESKEEWPPQWKEFRKSPQVRFGMINRNIYDYNIEDIPDTGDMRKYFQQLCDSRGYEVDCYPPASGEFRESFHPVEPKSWKKSHKLMARVKFALKEINAQAQKHGESYELVDIVRVVEVYPNRMGLFTFNVREVTPESTKSNSNSAGVVKTIQAMVFNHFRHFFELIEWRFRPGPPETPPENSLDICSKGFPPRIPPGLTADTVPSILPPLP